MSNMIRRLFSSSNASFPPRGGQLKIQKVKRFRRSLSPLLINSFYGVEVDVYFIRFKWFYTDLYLCAVIFGEGVIMQFVGEDVNGLFLTPLEIFETTRVQS